MLTQHNRKTCRLSPDYTFAIRELGVWSGDETIAGLDSGFWTGLDSGLDWTLDSGLDSICCVGSVAS